MGTSTDGLLMYGYDLGGSESGWKVEGLADKWDDLERPWLDEDDPSSSVEKALLTSVGFTETDWRAAGYFDRHREAVARVGVELKSYCSGDCPLYVLTAKAYTCCRGDCLVPDLTVDPAWNERLAHALKVLDLKPTQAEPRWLLASYWG